jgi:PAS domain S-box-containing protein
MLLLLRTRHEAASQHLFWVVASLIAMGLVDGLHGVHGISLQSWQRHGATLIGGVLCGLVWLPLPPAVTPRRGLFVFMVAGLALALGLWWGSEWMPVTWNPVGLYTLPVKAANALGGLGFLAAALFFCRRYRRQSHPEDLVFASLTVLFGMASLLFGLSHTWAADWWVWHGFRLLAYVILLVAAYGEVVTLYRHIAQYAQELEARVQERTAELATANAALRESEERFRIAAESLTDVVYDWDIKEKVDWYGDIDGIMGYPPGGFPRTIGAWAATIHPEDKDRVMAALEGHLKGAAPFVVEYRVGRRDGEWRWWSARGTALRNDRGEPYKMIGSITDITERKRAEEALRESEQRFRILFEQAIDGMMLADAETKRVTLANHQIQRLLGYSEAELLQLTVADLHPAADLPAVLEQFEQHSRGEITLITNIPVRRKDGTVFYADISASAVRLQQRDCLFGIFRDITERKEAEAQLQHSLADLERSNQELEQFAYIASHDLQEPLRMVSSYTQLLAQRYEGQLDDKAKKYINYAVDGAIRMQTLINDLLAYSRVGTQAKPLAPTDSHSVLGEAIRNLAATIEESRAIITNDDLPMVRADASQLVLVFQNLLANAIKFRSKDLPRVHVTAQNQGREWVFSVKDNGIGIEPQHAERVFVIFQRLHTRQEHPGTGIGLAVCKRIVERHGGKIWFESEPGNGTTFFFTLPK